jgi:hypothetical protein
VHEYDDKGEEPGPEYRATEDALDAASLDLVDTVPTTIAGARAALDYCVWHVDEYRGDYTGFPDGLIPEDSNKPDAWYAARDPSYFFVRNVSAALSRLAA